MNVATYQFDLRTGRRRATAGAPPHARVTLRGIVVENIWAAPRLFSWTCVARIPGESEPLILYEEDGSHARAPDGRPPRVRLRTMHERLIADRAQRRAFRRAWNDSTFCLTWSNPFPHWQRVTSVTFGVALLALLSYLTVLGIRFALTWPPLLAQMPAHTRAWSVGSLALLGLVVLVVGSLFLFGIWDGCLLSRGNVERATFTTHGFVATRSSGHTVRSTWDEVFHLSANGYIARISLLDGSRLRFPSDRRLLAVLRLAMAAVPPHVLEAAQQRARRDRLGAIVFCVIALLAATLIHHSPLGPGGHPLKLVGLVLLMPGSVLAVFGLLIVVKTREAKARIQRERSARHRLPPKASTP